jgi:uncharacterized membrane protein YjjB (DUF3815 family)
MSGQSSMSTNKNVYFCTSRDHHHSTVFSIVMPAVPGIFAYVIFAGTASKPDTGRDAAKLLIRLSEQEM